MRTRFANCVTQILDDRADVSLVLADISVGLFEPARMQHPDRVINVGIREQLLVSVAGGLALSGMRPIAHTYAPFLVERAFEQIKLDLGHQDVGAVLVGIGGSYDASKEGRTHQAPEDVALFDTLPGWTVYVPGHEDEAEVLLRAAIASEDRVYVRLSESSNAIPIKVTPGKSELIRRGSEGTIIAVGPVLSDVLEASEGLDVNVVYATTARPLDTQFIRDMSSKPNFILVEPYIAGTSAGVVTGALSDRPHRLLSVGVGRQEMRKYGSPADHKSLHQLDASGLRRRFGEFLAPRHRERSG